MGPVPAGADQQRRHPGLRRPRQDVRTSHYAFLVDDAEFDAAFGRIKQAGLTYWAGPHKERPGEINHHWGGRGVYFEDPNGHLLELITKPYGDLADIDS